MIINQLVLLILILFGLLTVSLILLIRVFIIQLKKNTDEYFIFIILIGIVISFLIAVILGMIQELT